MADKFDYPPIGRSLVRLAAVAFSILAIALVVHQLMGWFSTVGRSSTLMGGLLVLMLLVYAILIAVPFVPGVEIGISLMFLAGSGVAPYVYLATVLGLVGAFLAGRFLSYRWLYRLLADLRLKRACVWLDRMHEMPPAARVEALQNGVGGRWGGYLIRFRYLALLVLFNLPGNSAIGGGGGIAMLAGLSRLYPTPTTILTIALAVSPVPLTVWVLGVDILGPH